MGTQFTSKVGSSSGGSAISRQIGKSYREFKDSTAGGTGPVAQFSRKLGGAALSAIFGGSKSLNFAQALQASETFIKVLEFLRKLRADAQFKNLRAFLSDDPDIEPATVVSRHIGEITKPAPKGEPDDPFRVVASQAGRRVLAMLVLKGGKLSAPASAREKFAQALRDTSTEELTKQYIETFVSSYADDLIKSIDPNQENFAHGDVTKAMQARASRVASKIRDQIVAQGALADFGKIRSIAAEVLESL